MPLLLANLRGTHNAFSLSLTKLNPTVGYIYIKSGSMEDIAVAAVCGQTHHPHPHSLTVWINEALIAHAIRLGGH